MGLLRALARSHRRHRREDIRSRAQPRYRAVRTRIQSDRQDNITHNTLNQGAGATFVSTALRVSDGDPKDAASGFGTGSSRQLNSNSACSFERPFRIHHSSATTPTVASIESAKATSIATDAFVILLRTPSAARKTVVANENTKAADRNNGCGVLITFGDSKQSTRHSATTGNSNPLTTCASNTTVSYTHLTLPTIE